MTEQKVFSWVSKILFFGSIASYFILDYLVAKGYVNRDFGSSHIIAYIILMFITLLMGVIAVPVSRYAGSEKTKMNIFSLYLFRIIFYTLLIVFIWFSVLLVLGA